MVAETLEREPIMQYLAEKVTNISESEVGKAIKKNVECVPLLDSSIKLLSQKCDGTIQYIGELSSVLRERTGGCKDQLWVYVSKAKDVRDNIPTEKIQQYVDDFRNKVDFDVYETSKSYIPIESLISFLDHDKDGTVSGLDIIAHGQDCSDWVVNKAQEYYPQAHVELVLAYFMTFYLRVQEMEMFQKFVSMAFVSSILDFLTEFPAAYYASLRVWWCTYLPHDLLKTPVSSIFSLAVWKATLLKLVYRDEELLSFLSNCVTVFSGYQIWCPFLVSLKPSKTAEDGVGKVIPEEFDSDSDEFKEN